MGRKRLSIVGNGFTERSDKALKADDLYQYDSDTALDSMFTGEEGMGRYLDLNIAHTQYVNLKGAKR
jgi:hypothetical protein